MEDSKSFVAKLAQPRLRRNCWRRTVWEELGALRKAGGLWREQGSAVELWGPGKCRVGRTDACERYDERSDTASTVPKKMRRVQENGVSKKRAARA